MVAIQKRLKRLEGGGPFDPCDYCGDGGDGDHRTYEIVFLEDGEDPGPDLCPECGRRLVISFPDEGTAQ
jgi:hypothetical protein